MTHRLIRMAFVLPFLFGLACLFETTFPAAQACCPQTVTAPCRVKETFACCVEQVTPSLPGFEKRGDAPPPERLQEALQPTWDVLRLPQLTSTFSQAFIPDQSNRYQELSKLLN